MGMAIPISMEVTMIAVSSVMAAMAVIMDHMGVITAKIKTRTPPSNMDSVVPQWERWPEVSLPMR
jgi:hypothetical protein